MSQGLNYVGGFQEHNADFQAMPWPHSLLDLNLIEHIWDVMERQLRVQIPSKVTISWICVTVA